MKAFDIVLTTRTRNKNETIEIKTEANINLIDNTSFGDIVRFLNETKAVWKKARKAVKDGSFEQIEIIESSYDNWGDTNKDLIQTSFNRWVGYLGDQSYDDEGIYLRPDERYTEAHRDMYIGKNVLEDIAFTLR